MNTKQKKSPMRPRQHDATRSEVRDARNRKLTKAEQKEQERVRRIMEEGRLRRQHKKAQTKARNASREVFAEAMVRLHMRAKASADQKTTDVDWAEIYSAARAVGHQADKLEAIKEVLRLEKIMEEKGFTIYKDGDRK